MSTNTEVRLGLTHVFKRLAYSYLLRGLGDHPIQHELYDLVRVTELYPWQPNPTAEGEYGAAISVTFYSQGKKLRWVEFSLRFSGGGGAPSVRCV